MPSERGTGGTVSGLFPTSITLINSTTPQLNDFIYVVIAQNPSASGVYGTITPPSGFALVTDGTTNAAVQKSNWKKLSVWSKQAGGSETNSYQFSFGSSMDTCSANIIVESSVDTASPNPTVVTQDDTASNTAYTIPSITTKNANSRVLACICGGGNTANTGTSFASAWTNSYAEFVDIAESGAWAEAASAVQTKAVAGAVGTAQATSAVSDTSLAIVIEIKDGAAADTLFGQVLT